MKTNVIVGLIAFGLGYAVCFWFVDLPKKTEEGSMRQHWEVLERYKSELNDPKNEQIIEGMVAIDQQTDPLPALAALVSAGELRHVDLVLPSVPKSREANAYWMQYANEHDDILYAEGNTSYVDFEPSGDQPLHLKLWFRESAKSDIQQLIRDLEALPKLVPPENSTR